MHLHGLSECASTGQKRDGRAHLQVQKGGRAHLQVQKGSLRTQGAKQL